MFSRAILFLAAGASAACALAGCSSLTRPNEITVTAEPREGTKAAPPPPPARPAPALPVPQ